MECGEIMYKVLWVVATSRVRRPECESMFYYSLRSFENLGRSLTFCMLEFPLLKNDLKILPTSSDYKEAEWWVRVWPLKLDYLDLNLSSVIS